MHHFVIAIVPLFLVTTVDSSVAQTPGSAADVVHADAILLLRADGPGTCPCIVEIEGDSVYLDYEILPDKPLEEFTVELKLATDAFEINLDPHETGVGRLSLLRFEFGDRRLYGVRASSELAYDKKRDLYVGYERVPPSDDLMRYYRLFFQCDVSQNVCSVGSLPIV